MTDGCGQRVGSGVPSAPRSHDHEHRFACISRVPLFSALDDDDRHRVASIALTRPYERHQRVYGPGDQHGLHIVHRGAVKVYRLTESGSEQLIRILGPGEFLGEAAVLSHEPADHFAVAIEPSEVCSITRSAMHDLLAHRPAVARDMLHAVSSRLHLAEQRLESVGRRSVEERLAEVLLQHAAETGSSVVRLRSTKKDLASYLGTTAETLSRRLTAMQSAGLIRLGPGRTVEILAADRLRDLTTARRPVA